MRTRRPAAVLGALVAGLALPAAAASAEPLRLPTPVQAQESAAALLLAVGARPDRVLVSRVPGPTTNDEQVLVRLDGRGTPVDVTLEQHVVLAGTGDYQVRERGPARAARALSEESAPVTKLGSVVWQGFTSGDPPRELAALLVLDAGLEQARLPVAVTTSWTPDGGAAGPLGAGGTVPGRGTVVVEVVGRTALPAGLPTALDADAGQVATALDAARAVALGPPGPRLPTTGAGLPEAVEVAGAASRPGTPSVPLRLTGRIGLLGTSGTVSGGGTTPVLAGATVSGTLGGTPARFEVRADGPGRLDLDLTAVPVLDARALVPPGGAPSWTSWAAAGPDAAGRRAALDLLVDVAATGARATAFSPYLGADLPGTGRTAFRFSFAPAPVAAALRAAPEPRPGAIAVAGLAGLLVATGATALWRRS